jgi:hypothetical protein
MPNSAMRLPIDAFSLFVLGLLCPLLQLLSLIALAFRGAIYSKRQATRRSVYWAMLVGWIPWLTYLTAGYMVVNALPVPIDRSQHWVILLWIALATVNRIVLPITIGLTLLPPYPPRVWLSTIYRLSTIGMAIVAHHLTQQVFPIAP